MKLKFASLFPLLFASLTAFAGNGGEFSAEFTQSAPQQDEQHGRIYVGDGRMRMEFDTDGSTIIQIVDSTTQTVFMINTEEKTYMRQGGQGGPIVLLGGGEIDLSGAWRNGSTLDVSVSMGGMELLVPDGLEQVRPLHVRASEE